MKRTKFIGVLLIVIMIMVVSGNNPLYSTNAEEINESEMRGIWISSVWGLDYPSVATTDEDRLKREAVEMLNNIEDMGFNTVFLQVRPSADSLYPSEIFPWSRFLTGNQGQAPENNFDVLQFFIDEAHSRNIELHAWINPFRITAHVSHNDNLSNSNPAVIYPEIVVRYKDGKLYFNPGEPKARELIIDGIEEILDNYNVDGIHFDDYFYPGKDFDDYKTYKKYGRDFSDINDWRRNNINILIEEVNNVVHNKDSNLKFGVSPGGIWANQKTSKNGSITDGYETFTNNFADSRLWVKERYIDYIMPQIYWNIGYRIADYDILTSWWSDVVKDTNVKLYIGQAAYRCVGTDSNSVWYKGEEIKKQVEYNRASDYVDGYCMFRYNSFMENQDLYNIIKDLNVEKQNNIFKDISGHPLEEYINYLASKNIIMGYEGYFRPNDSIKRADFVLMLLRMFEFNNLEITDNFADVSENAYYSKGIATAKELGLINGVGNDMFAPENEITRQDIFVMTYRALDVLDMIHGNDSDNGLLKEYKDYKNISEYSLEAISYFTQNEILSGDNGNIKPIDMSNRAETATFLAKLLQSGMMGDK